MTRNKAGRKPLEDEPASKTINVRVTPAQRLALKRVASENPSRGGVSGVIREAVNEYVSDYDERRRPFRTHKM